MPDEAREDSTQAPPVDQPTEESPAVNRDAPHVVDSTAVEEPGEPPVRGAEEEVAPTGGPEPAPPAGGGTSPREADTRAAEERGGRPELVVIGAFAGAFLIARILKRVGGGNE
jgi:hypothetical protein